MKYLDMARHICITSFTRREHNLLVYKIQLSSTQIDIFEKTWEINRSHDNFWLIIDFLVRILRIMLHSFSHFV